jgi:hypothetical protein
MSGYQLLKKEFALRSLYLTSTNCTVRGSRINIKLTGRDLERDRSGTLYGTIRTSADGTGNPRPSNGNFNQGHPEYRTDVLITVWYHTMIFNMNCILGPLEQHFSGPKPNSVNLLTTV